MTLKEFKGKLNELPEEYDDYKVVFGQSGYGEPVKKIQKIGNRITISFF